MKYIALKTNKSTNKQ